VRAEAAARGLAVADKPDSHDVCFVPSGDTGAWLRARIGEQPGPILDSESGEVVGAHSGAYAFTVGQRRGLALERPAPDGRPRYVLGISPVSRTVTVGPVEALDVSRISADRVVWCGSPPAASLDCLVQVRAHGDAVPATASWSGDSMQVRLGEPLRGIAAGQAVVLYDGDRVIGSATVTGSAR